MNFPRDIVFEDLKQLITDGGAISFETFMDHVLYSEHGFYSQKGRIGVDGDYFTSPSLHPVFGSFLAAQVYAMWKVLKRPNPFIILEFGSGDGLLSKSIIDTIASLDQKFKSACQHFAIDKFHHGEITYVKKFLASADIPITKAKGVIFSNELIDAFPVRLLEVSNKEILEVFVTFSSDNTLVEILKPPPKPLPNYIYEKDIAVLEGFRGPVNDRLTEWYNQLSSILDSGFTITIDYGFNQDEYYSMANSKKLVQTYYKHVQGSSPYQRIGRQDITAHADFTALEIVGENNGFSKVLQTTQRDWLIGLGFDKWVQSEVSNGKLTRPMQNMINNLVDPNGLGKFKVLIQQKGQGGTCKYRSTMGRGLPDGFEVPDVTNQYLAHRRLAQETKSYLY